MANDRMFKVIVLGGAALVGGLPACGSAVGPMDASADSFPQETAADVSVVVDDFPREGPAQAEAGGPVDEGVDAGDVDAADAPAADAGSDASDDTCFPRETALPLDSGC